MYIGCLQNGDKNMDDVKMHVYIFSNYLVFSYYQIHISNS